MAHYKLNPIVMSKKNTETTSYIILSAISMTYIMLVLCSAVLTNKVVSIGPAITLAGVLIVPIIFCTADILAELFGYKIAAITVQIAFFCQLLFSMICTLCIKLPSPPFWHGYSQYFFVFSSLMKMSIASFIAYILSSTINVFILSKWRVYWRGKFFWVRSIGSSSIGELMYTMLIILLMQYSVFPGSTLTRMIITSYVIKIIFSALCAIPANLIVYSLKKILKTRSEILNEQYKFPFQN